jgi:hypothetical protein
MIPEIKYKKNKSCSNDNSLYPHNGKGAKF